MDLMKKLVKESLKIVIIASIISSIGGVGLEAIKLKLVAFVPLLIMLPALNSMIGDFGIIISGKFTTLLYTKKIHKSWWKSYELGDQFRIVSSIALFAAFYLGVVSVLLAKLQGFEVSLLETLKVVSIAFMSVATLVIIIFFLAIIGGLYIYKKGKDPNTFLIPVTTSIADFSTIILFATLVFFLF